MDRCEPKRQMTVRRRIESGCDCGLLLMNVRTCGASWPERRVKELQSEPRPHPGEDDDKRDACAPRTSTAGGSVPRLPPLPSLGGGDLLCRNRVDDAHRWTRRIIWDHMETVLNCRHDNIHLYEALRALTAEEGAEQSGLRN